MTESTRHSRQVLFPPIGAAGQSRIAASRVLIVGCGALGSHLAEFCVRAGTGLVRIVDRDFVEPSNLQRQSLFTEHDAAASTPKAEAAARVLRTIDSSIRIEPMVADFTHDNAADLAENISLVLDATDNFETRLLINDLCFQSSIPWVYAACVGSRAVAMPVIPGETACLSCLIEALPPASGETCDTSGIIMPAVLAAVAMASAETLKLMTGNRAALIRSLRSLDIWTGESATLRADRPDPDCRVCAKREFAHLSGRAASSLIRLCGRNAVQVRPPVPLSDGEFSSLAVRLRSSGAQLTASNEFLLRVAKPAGNPALELTLFRDGRALVSGTTDFAVARTVTAKLLGW